MNTEQVVINVLKKCLKDPEMIDHIVCEANVCIGNALYSDGVHQIERDKVTALQVKSVLEGMVENTDFSKYT
jgi:hypothetical protein